MEEDRGKKEKIGGKKVKVCSSPMARRSTSVYTLSTSLHESFHRALVTPVSCDFGLYSIPNSIN